MVKISRKGKLRYDAIIKAALETFLEKGYEGTSLGDIVKKSGGSMSSIYKFFNNKETLFATVLSLKFKKLDEELEKIEILKTTNNLREFLTQIGIVNLNFYTLQNIRILRLVISETYKNQQLVKHFGSIAIVDKVADFLSRPEIMEQLKFKDAHLLGLQFCAMIREHFFLNNVVMGEPLKDMSNEQKERIVAEVVELFLSGAKV